MKIDPYKNEERWLKWKEQIKGKIPEISKPNSDMLFNYLEDMERGINVANGSKKGRRSYIRLNGLKTRLVFLIKKFEEKHNNINVANLNEDQLLNFFSDMRTGKIKTQTGKEYKSVADYAKIFKAFWHWHQKVSRKRGGNIEDITIDLDTSREKAKWVYLTEEQIKKLCDNSNYKYRVLIMFLFDTGIRAPTELMNIKVSDLSNNCKELHIRDEISKTFGRRIKLLLCSDLLKDYIKSEEFKENDYIFQICPRVVNQYFKRLGRKY